LKWKKKKIKKEGMALSSPTDSRHSLLFYYAVERANYWHGPVRENLERARHFLWRGARLNAFDVSERHALSGLQFHHLQMLLAAERALDGRLNRCRGVCIAILHCMPGPRDCTRDWVRRLIWSTRQKRVWYPEYQMPQAYKRNEDD
jgi:hypothetical protein